MIDEANERQLFIDVSEVKNGFYNMRVWWRTLVGCVIGIIFAIFIQISGFMYLWGDLNRRVTVNSEYINKMPAQWLLKQVDDNTSAINKLKDSVKIMHEEINP